MSKFLIISLCFFQILFSKDISYILIHGTWAKDTTWYQEGGDFFDTLSCVIDTTDEIISFSWSGICLESQRRVAAINLVQFLQQHTFKNRKLVIIAHSHGGNVVLHALEYMQHHHIEIIIDFLILLGTPIAHNYKPEHISVNALLNIFSFGDLIQPVFGLFKRIMPTNNNIANFSIILHGKEPKHNELHASLFAYYVPQLYNMKDALIKNNKTLYRLELCHNFIMNVTEEKNHEQRLLQDQLFQEHLLSHLLWAPEEALYFLP